jgi:hypothetical protein
LNRTRWSFSGFARAGLEPRQLEKVVDQGAQRVDVHAHPIQVSPADLAIDDVVADRLCEQPQRRDRRAQIVRHGRDQIAMGGLGLVSRRLLVAQAPDHRVGRSGEFAQLVGHRGDDLDVVLAASHGDQTVSDRVDVAKDAAGQQPGHDRGQHAGEDHDPGHDRHVVTGDDHQQRDHDQS